LLRADGWARTTTILRLADAVEEERDSGSAGVSFKVTPSSASYGAIPSEESATSAFSTGPSIALRDIRRAGGTPRRDAVDCCWSRLVGCGGLVGVEGRAIERLVRETWRSQVGCAENDAVVRRWPRFRVSSGGGFVGVESEVVRTEGSEREWDCIMGSSSRSEKEGEIAWSASSRR
jgi:hypothetical protein